MQSTSFIGQPLQANIELVSLDDNIDVDRLIVRQVSQEEARAMGVEIIYDGSALEFKIDQGERAPYISVVSSEAVYEPFLNLLVELRWPNGVVYREYPVLLDPPPKAPVVAGKPSQQSSSNVSRQTPQSTSPADQTRNDVTVAGTRRLRLEPLASAEGKYKVQSGDTLSKIAERWREGTDRGIHDTMLWLHENNLHAFTNQNIDLLRAGAVLQMPNLSAYAVDNEVPAENEKQKAVQVKEPSDGSVRPTNAEEYENAAKQNVTSVNPLAGEASRGLLTVSTANQNDNARELIDMLVRENESLRARMEKVENSEYLETLKQLIILQRQQIADLRTRIGVSDTNVSDEMDDLLQRLGINREEAGSDSRVEAVLNDDELTVEEQSQSAPVELASENVSARKDKEESLAPVKVDPVLSAPVMASRADKNWLIWLIVGGGAALIAIFVGLYVYYRRIEPVSENEVKDDLFDPSEDEIPDSPIVIRAPSKRDEILRPDSDSIEYDGDQLSPFRSKDVPEDAWLGDRANVTEQDTMDLDAAMREVQEAFDDLLLDESLFEELDEERSLEALTEEMPVPAPAIGSQDKDKATADAKPKKKSKEPVDKRTDDELKMSIAEKMAQYTPHEYKNELEKLGLMELDELVEPEEAQDEIDTAVYRALMFCEFKRYEKARELLHAKMDESEDERLQAALEQVDQIEEAATNKANQQAG